MRTSRWALVAAALAAVCIVTIDQPIARWLATRETWPEQWNRGVAIIEYAAGIEPWKWAGMVVLVAGSLATLSVPRWRTHAPAWLLITLTHLLSRNLMLWLKALTGRLRPLEWLAHPGDTFFRAGGISFPSGHVVLFASLAVPLAITVPRTRWLLAAVGFVMVARVAVDAHFVSDVLAGLALVGLVTAACEAVVTRCASSPRPPPRE